MRTIIPCPNAQSMGDVSTEKQNESPVVDQIMVRTTHQAAVRIIWPGGAWTNFMEDGTLLSWSAGISYVDIIEAMRILPNMKEVAAQRRAFRTLLREEAEQVLTDRRIYHPGRGHSKNIGGCRKSTRDSMAEKLKALGYRTVDVWQPWCQQRDCDTHNWCLWPPVPYPEETYVA